ncbi:MAG TPA: ABC transporter permease [Terriglobales bacterium]|nr:ABC transporter permease [Terriglobales bacterium]
MYALAQDLRFAYHQLRKTPGFTLIIVLTLALGIGGTTAVFSLVHGVLLRPLPFFRSDRLVVLGDHLGDLPSTSVTAREIATYGSATEAFSDTGGYIDASYELSGGATPEQVNAARFTAGVFSTLGVSPALGRTFTRREEDGHEPVAVISYGLWLNRYHRDPQVVGTSIGLDRRSYSIIGVMPRSFEFPPTAGHLDQAQLWVPMSLTADELSDEHAGFWGYQMVARLKEDVSLEQAALDTDRVARQIMRHLPVAQSAIHIRGDVTPLLEYQVAEVRPLLRIFFLAVSVVLLLACANVAGLLLVRAIRRRSEYAVRLALGAGAGAIIRQSVCEGLLLGVTGGLLGLGFAATAIRTAWSVLPDSMPRIDSIAVDATVAGFALLLALATGALCSLAPAFTALRTDLTENLKQGVRTGTGSSSHTWLRSGLVVSEIAVALVLLITSGTFLRSFQKMRAVDPGFRPDQVLIGGYQLPLRQYPTNVSVDAFSREVLARLSNQPSVLAVGITNAAPAAGSYPETAYTVEGQPADSWKPEFAVFAAISGDYFRAMGIPLLGGRYFTMDDSSSSLPVVIVNESMAKRCWPGQRAIGKRIHVGAPPQKLPWATVVGVVSDTKMGSRDEPSNDQWYMPREQPDTLYGFDYNGNLTDPAGGYITVRSALPPEQMTHTLRSTVAAIDPLLALQQVQPMNEAIANVEAPRRFNTSLIAGFALGALLLALTGIYAVIAFSASLRTHEIAVRMALGAERTGIATLVLLSGAKLAFIGCSLGVLGSLAVSRMVQALLFEVSATDPLIYLAGALMMMITALLASALPATRAASVDPIVSLRSI